MVPSDIFPPFDEDAFSGAHDSGALQVPSHSLEAESSVLGALLLDNDSWDRVGDTLKGSDFYRPEHQLIYETICSQISVGKAADVITVFTQLKQQGKADRVGGMLYLNQLAQYVPSAANIRRYAEIVREDSLKRSLAKASMEVQDLVHSSDGSAAQIIDKAQSMFFALGDQGRSDKGFTSVQELVVTVLDQYQDRADNPGAMIGVPTGFADLDRMTSGLQAGDLVVLAARPSMGKTAFALNIAEHVAAREGLPVAIFSLEMSKGQLIERFLASLARVDAGLLRSGRLPDDQLSRLVEAVEQMRVVSLDIDDAPGQSASEMRASTRRLSRQRGGKLGLIVVDYLQLMGGGSDSRGQDNRATELGEISRGLKMLAKEMGCAVIALSQLNRSVEQRADKRPMMSDLRESGAIEQDADIIMFIYRDDYYNKESKEPNIAEIIIAKQRNGPTGTVKMYFHKNQTRFESLAAGEHF